MNVQDAKDMAPAGLENKVHGIFEATPRKENCYIVAPLDYSPIPKYL